jgi:hypothetical protein
MEAKKKNIDGIMMKIRFVSSTEVIGVSSVLVKFFLNCVLHSQVLFHDHTSSD